MITYKITYGKRVENCWITTAHKTFKGEISFGKVVDQFRKTNKLTFDQVQVILIETIDNHEKTIIYWIEQGWICTNLTEAESELTSSDVDQIYDDRV